LNHTRIVRLALAALVTTGLTLAVPACSNDDSGDEGRPSSTSKVTTGSAAATALAGVVDDVVAPGYDALVGSLTAWTFEIGQLCAEPGTERLEEARDGWRASVRAYESTVAHDIGPAMDQRLMSDLAFAPRVASIDKLLAGDDPVDAATMADRGANVRGLYSAEHALFGDGSEQLATAAGARRCEYLSSVATLAEASARAVSDAWTNGSARSELLAATGSAPEDALPQLLNAVTHAVKAVDEKGLRDMAAADSYTDLPETRTDGPGAFGMGKRKARLAGAVAVIGEEGEGLVAIVAERSPDTARRLLAAAEAAQTAVDALPDSVAETFDSADAAAELDAAAEAVAALKVVLATEVASQLGVTITLSDSDGDS